MFFLNGISRISSALPFQSRFLMTRTDKNFPYIDSSGTAKEHALRCAESAKKALLNGAKRVDVVTYLFNELLQHPENRNRTDYACARIARDPALKDPVKLAAFIMNLPENSEATNYSSWVPLMKAGDQFWKNDI